jgi:hypothetical protein
MAVPPGQSAIPMPDDVVEDGARHDERDRGLRERRQRLPQRVRVQQPAYLDDSLTRETVGAGEMDQALMNRDSQADLRLGQEAAIALPRDPVEDSHEVRHDGEFRRVRRQDRQLAVATLLGGPVLALQLDTGDGLAHRVPEQFLRPVLLQVVPRAVSLHVDRDKNTTSGMSGFGHGRHLSSLGCRGGHRRPLLYNDGRQ